MFSQTPETFLYEGPSVPSRYQSLTGTFSRASPQPIEHRISTGYNGTQLLSIEEILMMSGTIPNS